MSECLPGIYVIKWSWQKWANPVYWFRTSDWYHYSSDISMPYFFTCIFVISYEKKNQYNHKLIILHWLHWLGDGSGSERSLFFEHYSYKVVLKEPTFTDTILTKPSIKTFRKFEHLPVQISSICMLHKLQKKKKSVYTDTHSLLLSFCDTIFNGIVRFLLEMYA